MPDKIQPLGICDQCLKKIPPSLGDYTSKGKPRLYCSRQCRNTANSRAGAQIRGEKARERIKRGQWTNPADIRRADPADVAAGVSRARKREVEEGRWRNPALDDAAREKLSRPRKHSGALHRAIEKLGQGVSMTELSAEERAAHRAYRQQRRAARRDEVNAGYRRRYHEHQAALTAEERTAQRAKRQRESQRKAVAKQGLPEVLTTERTPDPETGELSFKVRLVRRWTRRADGGYDDEVIRFQMKTKRYSAISYSTGKNQQNICFHYFPKFFGGVG